MFVPRLTVQWLLIFFQILCILSVCLLMTILKSTNLPDKSWKLLDGGSLIQVNICCKHYIISIIIQATSIYIFTSDSVVNSNLDLGFRNVLLRMRDCILRCQRSAILNLSPCGEMVLSYNTDRLTGWAKLSKPHELKN